MQFSTALARAAFLLAVAGSAIAASNDNCTCGYYDSSTADLFTDSIIVFFNETQSIPSDDFIIQSYEYKYEKGWNTQYREGATPANVNIGNSSTYPESQTPQSLELYCDVTTPQHLVEGGGIRTSRQDIFFGSFRAMFRGTQKWQGGSALSIMALFNETESWQMDNINADKNEDAWVSMISHGQFPDTNLGIDYQTLETKGIDAWDWNEHRVDWLRDEIRYYIAGQLFRRVTRKEDSKLPQTPTPIFLKHWSTGNFFSTQGPPAARSLANVAWTRLFFNSSLTTDADRANFTSRCNLSDACSIDDMQLRGSSDYPAAATLPWKQIPQKGGNRTIPRIIAYTSISGTAFLLIFAFSRRLPWELIQEKASRVISKKHPGRPWLPSSHPSDSDSELFKAPNIWSTPLETPATNTRASSINNFSYGEEITVIGNHSMNSTSRRPNLMSTFVSGESSTVWGNASDGWRTSNTPSEYKTERNSITIQQVSPISGSTSEKSTSEKGKEKVVVPEVPAPPAPKAKVRVDYLAGLVAISSLLVTGIHFNLTFTPAAINPGAFVHTQSETWARKTITSFLLNLNWIGPFLMTSTRFLVSGYLRTGKLRGLAEKTVSRPFRLLIPIACIAMLEYFLMDSGATVWLEYLASVTWSTWPFTTVPNNFGIFVSEILELAYLIPNAAPQITFNYCTGVLWTIPVQLQGSWTTIMAVIMIREIKTPWKRFCFYAWCVTMHWYALSWGTYFYLAIMLTDLEITYDWKTWLYSHSLAYYPLVATCALLAVGGLGLDMVTQWIPFNFATSEYGIHPDTDSGLFIVQTPRFSYPEYFVPKFNGLVFSFFFQTFIELSPTAQKLLSVKVFTLVFPHIFTIYLIHGFIFWSLGSMVCVYLATKDFNYSLNLVIVAIVCYSTLALSLPILTPVVETLGKNVTGNIWRWSSEEPPKRRPTMYPFEEDLLARKIKEGEAQGVKEVIEAKDVVDVEKGGVKINVVEA